jgi:hypothetical protein
MHFSHWVYPSKLLKLTPKESSITYRKRRLKRSLGFCVRNLSFRLSARHLSGTVVARRRY